MAYNWHMPQRPAPIRRTYFGIAALALAILSALFLIAFFAISQLNISPSTFSFWSNLTLLISCSSAPLGLILGIVGYRKPGDSKTLASIASVLSFLPFLILFLQFALSFIP